MERMESMDSGSVRGAEPFFPGAREPAVKPEGVMEVKVRPATVQLGQEGEVYKMTSNPRGLVLLISNTKFSDPDTYEDRLGGEVDEANLESLFTQLGFQVQVRRNLTKQQTKVEVIRFRNEEQHTRADMMVLVVCSHGTGDGKVANIISADGKEIDYQNDIIRYFNNENCEALQGKPKMFMFQACRGKDEDFGVVRKEEMDFLAPGSDGRQYKKRGASPSPSRRMPSWTDIFIVHSTMPGYVAMRDFSRGAWFVESFVRVVMERSHNTELKRILDKVSQDLTQRTSIERMTKENCVTESWGFVHELFFNPGLYEPAN